MPRFLTATVAEADTPAEAQGNEIMLGEMRQAAALIVRSAGGEPYNVLVAVRDGAGGGYQYLLRHSSAPPMATPRPLRFLLVEPADRPPWLWPPDIRQRWSAAPGGFMRLPHLLLWRLRRGPIPPAGDPRWKKLVRRQYSIALKRRRPISSATFSCMCRRSRK